MARDVLGPAVVELRAYLAANSVEFAALTVRAGQPAFSVNPTTHAKTLVDAPPFIVLSHAGQVRDRRTGVVRQRLMARSYGVTPQQASILAGLVSDAFHDIGPRVRSTTGIYDSYEELGAQPDTDPDTNWPVEIAFYRFLTAAAAVA